MDFGSDKLQFEAFFSSILSTSSQIRSRDEFLTHVEFLWDHHHGSALNSSFKENIIQTLRLTGLLKRKYYQTSALGSFFLFYKLKISTFIQFFYKNFSFLLQRHLSKRISYTDFWLLLIACSKWYIQILKQDYSGWKLQTFQDVLCLVFDWYDKRAVLQEEIWPDLEKNLQEQYKQIRLDRKRRVHPRLIPKSRDLEDQFVIPQPRKLLRGMVLAKILTDIYHWMSIRSSPKDEDQSRGYESPFFDILSYSKDAQIELTDRNTDREKQRQTQTNIKKRPINISQYARTVTWIMKKEITNRETTYFNNNEHLRHLLELGRSALDVIEYIRNNLMIYFIKIKPNKRRRILIFSPSSDPYFASLVHQAKVLHFTCQDCVYLSKYTKIDCLLFKKLEFLSKKGYRTIPSDLQSLYLERKKPIFSIRAACPFWIPIDPSKVIVYLPRLERTFCACCHSSIEILPTPKDPVNCQCGTHYFYISEELTKIGVFECQLSENYSIGQNLTEIDPQLAILVERDHFQKELPNLSEAQIFNPQVDNPEVLFRKGPDYKYIREEDSVQYDKKDNSVLIGQKKNKLSSIKLLDTEKWNPRLQKLAEENPPFKFNNRSFNVNLSTRDKVTITKGRVPILEIKHRLKKAITRYPLPNLQVVYNVGKPRINKPLKKWGVRIIYESAKGVSSDPKDEIKEAMNLPGVQQTLQELHLQGLMISIMNATYYLNELAKSYDKEWLGARISAYMNRLLQKGPDILTSLYHTSHPSSFGQVSLVEAWFSRPFAEGIRRLVRAIQDPEHPLLRRPYGRSIARRVNKREKQGVDFMGGYTSFDSALNCINRRLRHQLRIWNAKIGLGFYTIPLFVHTSSDKPGRAGHLDLEEVGRIISRITLCQAIAEGKIKYYNFKERFDDEYIPYYVPTEQMVKWLRKNIVRKTIFPNELFYNNQWMPFSTAHKHHVQHLCSCLEGSLELREFDERTKYLRQTYHPLIFRPRMTFKN